MNEAAAMADAANGTVVAGAKSVTPDFGQAPPAPLGAGMPVLEIHRPDGGPATLGTPLDAGADSAEIAGNAGRPAAANGGEMDAAIGDAASGNDTGGAGGSAGASGAMAAGGGSEAPASAMPIHRYDFAGDGPVVADKVGRANGRLSGGAFQREGTGLFDGVDGYLQLSSGLMSHLSAVTILVWLRWDGGSCGQRVFELAGRRGNGQPADAPISSLFLAAQDCNANALALVRRDADQNRELLAGPMQIRTGQPTQVGFSLDSSTHQLRLIADGKIVAHSAVDWSPRDVQDTYTLFGRSLDGNSPPFHGALDEIRIYDQALTEDTLQHTSDLGPDTF